MKAFFASKLFIALVICSFTLTTDNHNEVELMPIVILPGLGSSCEREEKVPTKKEAPGSIYLLKKAFEKPDQSQKMNPIYCIPYNTSVSGNIKDILKQLCEFSDSKLKEWDLKNGFIGIGLSQGGLFMRHILQHCASGAFMKRIITIGTPNMGIAEIPIQIQVDH